MCSIFKTFEKTEVLELSSRAIPIFFFHSLENKIVKREELEIYILINVDIPYKMK